MSDERFLPRRSVRALSIGAVLICGVASAGGCSTTHPNLDPTGDRFPTVRGESLDEKAWTLPDDLAGQPAILLVGYDQNSQFDLDRWLFGLLQANTPVRFLEVPTIPGLVPSMFSGSIDSGMRSGIPSEDWGVVVTLYREEAQRVVEATGNTNPTPGRVFLLDGDGTVVWFTDRGYSARLMLELDGEARALVAAVASGPGGAD
ncbi:MAG: hypothetical protein ACYS22_15125 [Planctomycetota bacterium]|jgi:hypothetical protein